MEAYYTSLISKCITVLNQKFPEFSPQPVFDISFISPNGTDLSKTISVLHYPHLVLPSSSSSPNKRDLPRALNSCGDSSQFKISFCQRRISPQAYQIRCRNLTTNRLKVVTDACTSSEICVDRKLSASEHRRRIPRLIAYCVSTSNFVQIARLASEDSSASTTFQDTTGTSSYAIEAVVTGLDNTTSLFAQSLTIQAQESSTVSNTQLWGTLPNGFKGCNNCAAIAIGERRFSNLMITNLKWRLGLETCF